MPLPLKLNFREVAQANIDRFDELGAFHGATSCQYHYAGGYHCAVGLCDPNRRLPTGPVGDLVTGQYVETDNVKRLELIQTLHDYRVGANIRKDPIGIRTIYRGEIPVYLLDLVEQVHQPTDVTPERYKEIMRRIAAEPETVAA